MRIHLGLCQRPSPRARHLTLVILSSCPLPNQAQQCVPLHLSRSSSFDSVKQMYGSPSIPAMRTNGEGQASQVPQGNTAYQPIGSQYHIPPGVPPTLPPLSSMEHAGPPRPPPDNLSSVRHQHTDSGHSRHFDKQPSVLSGPVAGKRPFPTSAETSADSSDEDENGGELPASGLVAPWEVLRGLADVAIQRAAKVSQYGASLPIIYIHPNICRRMAKKAVHRVVQDRPLQIPDHAGPPRGGGINKCLASSSFRTVS
jgi:hypothetical protein